MNPYAAAVLIIGPRRISWKLQLNVLRMLIIISRIWLIFQGITIVS